LDGEGVIFKKQTSCLGISLLIQNVVYDTATGKYNITVVNNGDQQVIAGRLHINFVNIQGAVDSKRPQSIIYLDGTPINPTQAILPNEKFKMIEGTSLDDLTYVYITHDVCGKISNDYLVG